MKMKCMLATATAIVLCMLNRVDAQNTFPATGNAGVGTTTPANKLTVKGDGIGVSNESANGAVKVGFYVTGASAFLQTHTNHPLAFATNNGAVQATLLTNGNFGIGTSSPAEKLSVRSGSNALGFSVSDGSIKFGVSFKSDAVTPNDARNGAVLSTTSNHNLHFRANNATAEPQMSITTSGNVGVGISSPSYMLQVSDRAWINTVEISSGNDPYGSTGVGGSTLISNTTGFFNTALGRSALQGNTTGSQNVGIGNSTLFSNTTGYGNTCIGSNSMENSTGASQNTGVGYSALSAVSTGVANTAIGAYAGPNDGTLNNSTHIGFAAHATASNQVRIGNSSVTSIGGYANWTNVSDARVKRNIKANVPGLQFINKLIPVTYNLDLNAAGKIIGITNEKEIDEVSRRTKEQELQTGFIAQDVEKAAKEAGYKFSGVDVPKNDKDLYGLRYAEFVVPLVKAVQELSKMNEEKDAQIKNLQQQIDELKEMIKGNKTTGTSSQNIKLTSALLEQNVPNPFSDNTTVAYSLPEKYSSAKMVISDKSGKIVKEITLAAKGSGTVNVNCSTLNSGTYQYTLYADGVLVETKQMILAR